jgi:hypothetical protein
MPLPSSFGPVSFGTSALIILLAALGRLFGAAFALPRPDALSPRPLRSLRRAHCARRCGHPSPAALADRGGARLNFALWAFSELPLYAVLRSSPRKFQELVSLGDTPHLEEGYASGRNQKARVVRHFYPSRKEKVRCSGSQTRRLCG